MIDIKKLTSGDILSIPNDAPEKLYTITNIKYEYRVLAAGWHPDRNSNKQAEEVFKHIKLLYELAEERIEKGLWNGPSEISFTSKDNTTYRFKYRCIHELEIGKMYIGKTKLLYVIDPDFEDLFRNGIKMIGQIKYPAPKYEEQFKRQMPNIIKSVVADIGLCVIMEKTEDLVLLRDLLDYLPEHKLPIVHVAWILSTLCNLACFLEMNNIAHGAISSDTFWITPKFHSGVLLGGWFFSQFDGEQLLALPQESLSILPSNIFVDKKAKSEYDRTLIKTIGLEMLGDTSKTGSMLLKDKTVPNQILSWLRGPTAKNAIEEYKRWGKVRDDSLGPRKFVELDVDISKIY